MNTTHTTPEMRDAFETAVRELFDSDEHTLNRTADGIYYNAVRSKTCDGWLPVEYAPVSMLFELWQAAQSQPAPPVPSSVQEIMPLVNAYVGACVTVMNARHEEIEEATKLASKNLATLQAALTALVEKNHELQFSLDGVNAMRRSLTEEVDHIHEILRRQGYHRDVDHFVNVNLRGAEAIHVTTIATIVHAVLAAPNHGIEPEQGESHAK